MPAGIAHSGANDDRSRAKLPGRENAPRSSHANAHTACDFHTACDSHTAATASSCAAASYAVASFCFDAAGKPQAESATLCSSWKSQRCVGRPKCFRVGRGGGCGGSRRAPCDHSQDDHSAFSLEDRPCFPKRAAPPCCEDGIRIVDLFGSSSSAARLNFPYDSGVFHRFCAQPPLKSSGACDTSVTHPACDSSSVTHPRGDSLSGGHATDA